MVVVTGPEDATDRIAEALLEVGEPLTLLGDTWLLASPAADAADLHARLHSLLGDVVSWITVAQVGHVVSDIPQTIPVDQWLDRNPG